MYLETPRDQDAMPHLATASAELFHDCTTCWHMYLHHPPTLLALLASDTLGALHHAAELFKLLRAQFWVCANNDEHMSAPFLWCKSTSCTIGTQEEAEQ